MEPDVIDTQASPDAIDVDQLLSDIANPPTTETPAAPPEAPAWKGEEWEFDWNGKKIVPDSRDKLKIWAQQGYNYSQRMGEMNRQHTERLSVAERRERAAQEAEAKYKPYVEIDDYARTNKEWWDHVQQSYASRQQTGLDPSIKQALSPIEEKLSRFEQFLADQEQQKEQAKIQQEDEALDAEIESIRKSHPNIDLGATDETGETLERRIYKHATDNKIGTFRAAFRDYLHDQLVVQQQAQSKIQAVKGTQAQAKAGLLGTTQTPTKQLKPVDTSRSWNDPQFSAANVLEEFRKTGG